MGARVEFFVQLKQTREFLDGCLVIFRANVDETVIQPRVATFLPHDQEWMRERFADQWLGFSSSDISHWLGAAGFRGVSVESIPPLRAITARISLPPSICESEGLGAIEGFL